MADLASVIVLSYNGKDYLGPCLTSLLASDYTDMEILLVDNCSQDGSAAWATEAFPMVRVVSNSQNLGFAGGMNRGIGEARGRFIALLNQDTTVRPDWLSSLIRELKAQNVGIAGSKIYYPDGSTIQHAGGIIRYPQALADHYGYRQPDHGEWDETRDVDYVTGAAIATRRDVLDVVGGFDEGFFPAYFEDTDLCFRIRSAGFRVLYVPQAVVIHHESATTVRDSYGYYEAYHAARVRFIMKHYSAAQFVTDFYPVERTWLSGVQSDDERRALQRAYSAFRHGAAGQLPATNRKVRRLLDALARDAIRRSGGARQDSLPHNMIRLIMSLLSR